MPEACAATAVPALVAIEPPVVFAVSVGSSWLAFGCGAICGAGGGSVLPDAMCLQYVFRSATRAPQPLPNSCHADPPRIWCMKCKRSEETASMNQVVSALLMAVNS